MKLFSKRFLIRSAHESHVALSGGWVGPLAMSAPSVFCGSWGDVEADVLSMGSMASAAEPILPAAERPWQGLQPEDAVEGANRARDNLGGGTSSIPVGCLVDDMWKSSGVTSLALPWDKGVMKSIFGGVENRLTSLPIKKVEPVWGGVDMFEFNRADGAHVAPPAGHSQDKPVYEHAVKFGIGSKGGTALRDDREACVRRWACILEQNPKAIISGLDSSNLADPDLCLGILKDIFSGKSCSTVVKRARCIVRMMKWSLETRGIGQVLPLTSGIVLSYLRDLRADAKHSAMREVGETINFLKHVVGLEMEDKMLERPWIKGLLRGAAGEKGETKQTRPLTVVEVMALESALIGKQGNKVDRYAIGVFLFQLYSRARVSDIQNISSFEVDVNALGDFRPQNQAPAWSRGVGFVFRGSDQWSL